MKSLMVASVSTLPGFVIAWFLSNHFASEDYSFYLLIQNISIGINLVLNFGINTFMLKFKAKSSLWDAVNELKIIYITYVSFSIFIAIIYYFEIYDRSIGAVYFLVPAVISAFLVLITNNFQQFYIGQGKMSYAHIRYVASPKIIGLIIIYLFYLSSVSFNSNSIWFYLGQLCFSLLGINLLFLSDRKTIKSVVIIRTFSHQWITFFLHGIYSPLLIMYLYSSDKMLVQTLGIAILISQPARMVYQFSIQSKIRIIKENISENNKTINIRKIYKGLSINSTFLISIYIGSLYLFESIISSFLFPNIEDIFKYSLFFITYQFINSLFGPNGTILALINESKYDAYSALFKIVFFVFLMLLKCDVVSIMILMMLSEIVVNFYKNIKLNLFISEDVPIFYPTLISLFVVSLEASFFAI